RDDLAAIPDLPAEGMIPVMMGVNHRPDRGRFHLAQHGSNLTCMAWITTRIHQHGFARRDDDANTGLNGFRVGMRWKIPDVIVDALEGFGHAMLPINNICLHISGSWASRQFIARVNI